MKGRSFKLKKVWKTVLKFLLRTNFHIFEMEYYRSQLTDGIIPSTSSDNNNTILNVASDSYSPDYWNIPYTNGLSPMKQIEGREMKILFWRHSFSSFFVMPKVWPMLIRSVWKFVHFLKEKKNQKYKNLINVRRKLWSKWFIQKDTDFLNDMINQNSIADSWLHFLNRFQIKFLQYELRRKRSEVSFTKPKIPPLTKYSKIGLVQGILFSFTPGLSTSYVYEYENNGLKFLFYSFY